MATGVTGHFRLGFSYGQLQNFMFKTCLLVGQPYFVTIFTDVDRDQLACCLGLYVAYSPRAFWLLVVRRDGREYPEVSGHVKAGRVCAGRVISGHGISAAEAKKDESGLSEPLTSSSNQL